MGKAKTQIVVAAIAAAAAIAVALIGAVDSRGTAGSVTNNCQADDHSSTNCVIGGPAAGTK